MSGPLFQLHYELTGTGWARCVVVANDKTVVTTASYLSDALGSLAACALGMRRGFLTGRVGFDEEPGEYRWGIDRHQIATQSGETDGGWFRIRIWWFEELWSQLPDESGKLLLDEIVPSNEFHWAMLDMLETVLKKYGEAGYFERWVEHPFPSGTLQDYRLATAQWPGKPPTTR